MTPQRLVCALVEALGAGRVETIADILRTFNAQTGLRTQYKAFDNRLAQPAFPRFMRQISRDILRNLSVNILRPATMPWRARLAAASPPFARPPWTCTPASVGSTIR